MSNNYHCESCRKTIQLTSLKSHLKCKKHRLRSGELQDDEYEWFRKAHLICDKSFPVFKKRNELTAKFNDIQTEIHELTTELDKYWTIRDIEHNKFVTKGNIDEECLICTESKKHFNRELLCCHKTICFDCLVQTDKCPYCRKEFKEE